MKHKLTVEQVANLKQFQGMTLIATAQELDAFLSRQRQDYYAPEKIASLKLHEKLDAWVKSRRSNVCTFFAAADEPDDHMKNDGWGKWTLFRCAAILAGNGETHLLLEKIHEFFH